MQVLIKRGEFVEQGKLEHVQGIGVGELVYDTDKQGIYTNDGANNMIRIAEVLLAPEGAAYARLPNSSKLIPLCLHMPGLSARLRREEKSLYVVLRGSEYEGVSRREPDSFWLDEDNAKKRLAELKAKPKEKNVWYEIEDYVISDAIQ